MKKVIQFILNEQAVCIETDPAGRLLDTIRDILGYKGTKEGCGIGECGACTVIMDGRTVNSCVTLNAQAEGRKVTTIEGLAGDRMADVIKKAYVEEGAVQCGFCIPGMVLSTYVLLKENPKPTQDEVRDGLSGNLCRCTGYTAIIRAVLRAAKELSGKEPEKEGSD